MCLMIKTFTLNRNKNINNNNNIENQLAKFLPKCKMARIEKIFSISFCFIDFPFSNKEIHDRKIHIWLIRFALVFFEQQQRRRWWWFSIFIKKNYKSNHDEPWWMMMMMTNLFFHLYRSMNILVKYMHGGNMMILIDRCQDRGCFSPSPYTE